MSLQNIQRIGDHRFILSNGIHTINRLQQLKRDGPSKLCVVSDFDFTLTKFLVNGKRGSSCHKVIEDCGMLDASYHDTAQALQQKYYPLEIDPSLDQESRTKFMVEWVTQAHDLLIDNKLTAKVVKDAVMSALTESRLEMRSNTLPFFDLVEKNTIPLLVFSAGIADVLEEVLSIHIKSPVKNHPMMNVISNKCIFDETGTLKGFEEPCIHVFNKKCTSYLHSDFFQRPDITDRSRHNVILIGDSLGDVNMSEGMPCDANSLFKIGFLNDRVDDRAADFINNFDLVILGDPGFDIPLCIINGICSTSSEDSTLILDSENLYNALFESSSS